MMPEAPLRGDFLHKLQAFICLDTGISGSPYRLWTQALNNRRALSASDQMVSVSI
jgi:hypothetical protein